MTLKTRLMTGALFLAALGVVGCSQPAQPLEMRHADNGDGTYTNPPLYGDFPDPDIIRVGEDFYFATTTFANVPGLTILHSKDLVSWEYAGHVVSKLDGMENYDLQNGKNAYRRGIFAPSLRYHEGTFYAAVTPVGLNTRIYFTKDVRGEWDYYELDRQAFDPALFFDTDGKGYVGTAIGSDGTFTILELSDDYRTVVSAKEVYYNKGAEGSKLVKKDDWYYLFHSIPGRLGSTISRAKSLYGPWEVKVSIDDKVGGHQGAIVDLPDGTWYGFTMLDLNPVGRVTNISPIHWVDDWPIWGTPDAPDQVPATSPKPIMGKPKLDLATSDDFSDAKLGLQWQWNHNPLNTHWSLTERPGHMRLKATKSDTFWSARNTLTQKGLGPKGYAEVKVDVSQLKVGDKCGFGTIGKYSGLLAVNVGADGNRFLSMQVNEDTVDGQVEDVRVASEPLKADKVWLRTDLDLVDGKGNLSYSLNGRSWTPVGGEFVVSYDWRTGTFQGPQYALFCFNAADGGGHMDVDSFRLSSRR